MRQDLRGRTGRDMEVRLERDEDGKELREGISDACVFDSRMILCVEISCVP